MDWLSIIFLSFGLAMDAFAVSISCSIAIKQIKIRHALRIAFLFGLFQAGMPLIGWLASTIFRHWIREFDHWIAFGLLAGIGGKMIYESFRMECDKRSFDPLNLMVLLGLAVATSIDALAAGVGFGVLEMNIWTVVTVIGVITFVLSFLGTRIGKRLGCHFGSRVEMLGGIILVGIGIKIVIEHFIKNI